MGTGVDQFVERYQQQLEPADVATLHDAAAATAAFLKARPGCFTLLHGDYRLDNLMFDDQVHVVDWQTVTVGLPARDLAYFPGTSLHTEDAGPTSVTWRQLPPSARRRRLRPRHLLGRRAHG